MVALFSDSRMLDHRPRAGHPERPERLQAVLRHLERTGLAARCSGREVRPATDEELLRVHTAGPPRRMVEGFEASGRRADRGGYVGFDQDRCSRPGWRRERSSTRSIRW